MHFLLLLQACGVTCRLTLLGDPVGGIWMLVTTGIGIYAWLNEMDVAFVSLWGILSFLNCVFDVVLVSAPLIIANRPVEGAYFAVNLLIAAVHIASALFAVHLYHVNAAHRLENHGHHLLPGFDPLGRLFDSRDPEAAICSATGRVAHAASGAAAASREAVSGMLHAKGHIVPGAEAEAVASRALVAGAPHDQSFPIGVTMRLDEPPKASHGVLQ